MGKTFTGEEFVKVLAEGKQLESFVLNGMVKKSDDPKTILFAPGHSCSTWVSVPVSMIEKVEWLGKVPCKDHQHDHVRLFMKDPSVAEAAVFARLLQGLAVGTTTGQPMPLGQGKSMHVAGACPYCVWGGQQFSPGAIHCDQQSGIGEQYGILYTCQPDGSWRQTGFCPPSWPPPG
jgi:hypothetical protein